MRARADRDMVASVRRPERCCITEQARSECEPSGRPSRQATPPSSTPIDVTTGDHSLVLDLTCRTASRRRVYEQRFVAYRRRRQTLPSRRPEPRGRRS